VGDPLTSGGFSPRGKRPALVIVGPVYPYRGGIAYCTTRLAEELAKDFDVQILSFKRQYPKRFYPGDSDVDETLADRKPRAARFELDILRPLTWLRAARRLRKRPPDAVIFVWWIWVWAIPYIAMLALLPRSVRRIFQCHNIRDKEPAWWKSALTNAALRRADVLVVHAKTEAEEVRQRLGLPETDGGDAATGPKLISTFLPAHDIGGAVPTQETAKSRFGLSGRNVALFFGHVRPFKGLDIALTAWTQLRGDVTLLVAGEVWWGAEEEYRRFARHRGLLARDTLSLMAEADADCPHVIFDFRYIPDAEVTTYFAAADVVLAPYRTEAQSGVALTAFHFGKPVIASAVGGLPEVIEEGCNGLLIPPEDPRALARAVERFFAEGDRARWSRAAAESAARYSWSEYGALFRRLIAPEGR
jgi:glycosyltransferase involved in cell wall biosynthesis